MNRPGLFSHPESAVHGTALLVGRADCWHRANSVPPEARGCCHLGMQAGDVTVQFVGRDRFHQFGFARHALSIRVGRHQERWPHSRHGGRRGILSGTLLPQEWLHVRRRKLYHRQQQSTLQLKVNEGPLVVLGDIHVNGNDHFKDPTNFQQYIIGQTRERFPASRKDLPYVEADVQKGADLIQRFYLSQGYLEARVGEPSVEFVNGRTRANLTIPVIEGRAYHFGDGGHRTVQTHLPTEGSVRTHQRPTFENAVHPGPGSTRCSRKLEDLLQEARLLRRNGHRPPVTRRRSDADGNDVSDRPHGRQSRAAVSLRRRARSSARIASSRSTSRIGFKNNQRARLYDPKTCWMTYTSS